MLHLITEAMKISKDEMERSKNQIIALKDAEISEHKQKMDDMALEFSQMLKTTLDKMTEKIAVTNELLEASGSGGNKTLNLDAF